VIFRETDIGFKLNPCIFIICQVVKYGGIDTGKPLWKS